MMFIRKLQCPSLGRCAFHSFSLTFSYPPLDTQHGHILPPQLLLCQNNTFCYFFCVGSYSLLVLKEMFCLSCTWELLPLYTFPCICIKLSLLAVDYTTAEAASLTTHLGKSWLFAFIKCHAVFYVEMYSTGLQLDLSDCNNTYAL